MIYNDIEIKKLRNSEVFVGTFLVKSSKVIHKDSGTSYGDLVLTNGESDYKIKMWNVSMEDEIPKEGLVVDTTLAVNDYNGVRGFIMKNWHVSDTPITEFEVRGPLSVEELESKFELYLKPIFDNKTYSHLYKQFKIKYMNKIFDIPAAVGNHHAYRLGWAQHTLEVIALATNLVNTVKSLNPEINIYLPEIVAGSLFHDIGKLNNYRMENCIPTCNEAEGLLGHIVTGYGMVRDLAEEVGIPKDDEDLLRLLHDIVSHHEKPEWGACARPASMEALIISSADLLSARVSEMHNELSKLEPSELSSKKSFVFETRLFGPRKND